MRLGEWCQIKWPYPLCPRVQGDVDTSAHLGNPLACVPLLCKRPALKNHPPSQPVRQSVFACDRFQRSRLRVESLSLSTPFVEHSRKETGKGLTVRMPKVLRQRQPVVDVY